jgi:radical SAM protein with 4Fe4S-binding SPASM domain
MIFEKNNDIDFDIDDPSIARDRNITIKVNGHRFRLFFEITTACFGNCNGCSLSSLARKDSGTAMSIENIKNALDYFVPIINSKKHLRTTILNFGTGDYFLIDEGFLTKLFTVINDFFSKIHTVRNGITIPTSLFLSQDKMKPKLELISSFFKKTQVAVEGVIDADKLEHHYDRYMSNYSMISSYLPLFDVALNISSTLTERQGELFTRFLNEANILNFDLQYAINNTNDYRVKIGREHFEQFFENVYKNIPNYLIDLSVSLPTASHDDDTSIFDEINKNALEIIRERLIIDPNGNIFPLAFGFGDILLTQKYDFPPIGHISKPFNEEEAQKTIADYLKKIFVKNKVCHTCEFNKQCYGTGYAFYNKFNKTTSECENVGTFFFKKLKDGTITIPVAS